ncbi:MAG: EamA family transporter [Planctomycetaceae bacterium]
MKPILFALAAAAAWGIGGYFEKRGMALGNLPPQVAITVRTAVALLILGAISSPHWSALGAAGGKSLAYLIVGGGVVAGAVGMLCFYAAIHEAPLSRVMPIAFTAPLFGAAMGLTLGGEPLTARVAAGIALCMGGVYLLTGR